MLITDGGTLVRNRVSDISLMGRGTQGVTMIRLSNKERLIGLARVESLEMEDEEGIEPGEDITPPEGPSE